MSFRLNITPVALRRLADAIAADKLDDSFFVRASVSGGGCSGFENKLVFSDELDPEEDSIAEYDVDGKMVRVVVDAFSQMYMQNVTLDYVVSDLQEGFSFSGGSANRKHCACGSSFSE